jgi:hypothetical protein
VGRVVIGVDDPTVVAEVAAALARYEEALASNDVEVLVDLFWDSPQAIRFGPEGSFHGADEIAAFRRAGPAPHPSRRVDRRQITVFGRDAAVASVEYTRTSDGVRGQQSQTWVRTPQGWKVVLAHVSHRARTEPSGSGSRVGDGLASPDDDDRRRTTEDP